MDMDTFMDLAALDQNQAQWVLGSTETLVIFSFKLSNSQTTREAH